jgi:methionyl-tRNA synthetase
LGNVVDPIELAERFGVDSLRYFLLREVSFGNDGSYSAEAIVTRCNAELANSFGNLAQRTLSMIFKNMGGVLKADCAVSEADEALTSAVAAGIDEMRKPLPNMISAPVLMAGCARFSHATPMLMIRPMDLAQDRSGADGGGIDDAASLCS